MYMINPDGTDLTQLTKATAREYGVSNRSSRCRISKINWLNSTEIASISYEIGYSPDGTKKVFTREKNETARAPGEVDLYVADADGTNETQITNTPLYTPESTPTWSPDGKKIAYARPSDIPGETATDIFVINADGSNETNLTETADADHTPVWSPDGDKIAFLSTSDYSVWNVCVMNYPDGTDPTCLTGTGGSVYDVPVFSPDSTKIAFVSQYGKVGEPTKYDIYVQNVDGTGLTRLTHTSAWEGIFTWLRAKNE